MRVADCSRLRTAYLNGTRPEDYQYQEMGRVPESNIQSRPDIPGQ